MSKIKVKKDLMKIMLITLYVGNINEINQLNINYNLV